MREITTHAVNGLNEAITIQVLDAPGDGGAHHHYNLVIHKGTGRDEYREMRFQKGPIAEAGVNGISNEALLAIVRDRLECFQAGAFACEENEKALVAVLAAMSWLHARTKARLERGVEGTSQQ